MLLTYLRRLCSYYTYTRRHNYKLCTLAKLGWFAYIKAEHPDLFTWLMSNVNVTDESFGEGTINAFLVRHLNKAGTTDEVLRQMHVAAAAAQFNKEFDPLRRTMGKARGACHLKRNMEGAVSQGVLFLHKLICDLLSADEQAAPQVVSTKKTAGGVVLRVRATAFTGSPDTILLAHKTGAPAHALNLLPRDIPDGCHQFGCAGATADAAFMICGHRSCSVCSARGCDRCRKALGAAFRVNATTIAVSGKSLNFGKGKGKGTGAECAGAAADGAGAGDQDGDSEDDSDISFDDIDDATDEDDDSTDDDGDATDNSPADAAAGGRPSTASTHRAADSAARQAELAAALTVYVNVWLCFQDYYF
jgi:hypothetical protein